MTASPNDAALSSLTELALADLEPNRSDALIPSNGGLDHLANYVYLEGKPLKVVYTAFDGDHQMLCGLMRRRAIADGVVPANPDSVLGYKETVEFRKTKEKVLLDDLSVLRGCDELWVFTDEEPNPNSCPRLAEGVLVELLFFLKRYPAGPVKFFRISDLLHGNTTAAPAIWSASYNETAAALANDQREEILQLANSGTKVDRRLKRLKYFLLDPLDFKYARFVRARGYSGTWAPVVPYLAVRVEDFSTDKLAAGRALIYWAKLLSLASILVKLPPLDTGRAESLISQILERIWLRSIGSNEIKDGIWDDYDVPKAQQEDKWAVTKRERHSFRISEE